MRQKGSRRYEDEENFLKNGNIAGAGASFCRLSKAASVLSEEDYEALSDDPYQINGAKETINYQVCQPLDVWEYPARILVIFSDFEGKEPVLVAVKAVSSGSVRPDLLYVGVG